MANEDLEAFLRRASNYHGGNPEFYEDTHDSMGNYIGPKQSFAAPNYGSAQPMFSQPTTNQHQAPPLYTQPNYMQNQPPKGPTPEERAAKMERDLNNPPKLQYYNVPPQEKKAAPLPKLDQYIAPRMYQNMVLYSPKTANDVERLIDYLRRREPAIIDLDPIAEEPIAQRVLDFTSGAVYALGGRIIGIKSNTFLIVPDGIDVATPENGD